MNNIADVNGKFVFARPSNAYNSDGKLVIPHNARYEPASVGLGNGIMFEESTTNLLSNVPLTAVSASNSTIVYDANERMWTITRTSGTDITIVMAFNFFQQLNKTYTTSYEIWADVDDPTNVVDWNDNIYLNGSPDTANIPQNDTWRKSVTIKNNFTKANQWVRYEKTVTTRAVGESFATNYANTTFTPVLAGHTALSSDNSTIAGASLIKIRNLQIEERTHPTTYTPTTRSAEYLAVSTSGLFGATEGTVELTFIPNYNQDDTQRTASMRYIMEDSNQAIRFVFWNGNVNNTLTVDFNNSDNSRNNMDFFDYGLQTIKKGVPLKMSMTWSGSTINGFLNGSKFSKTATGVLKSIGTVIYLGCANNQLYQGNGIITDVRFSNIFRTDTELIANGTSTIPLPYDANTTLKLDFNEPDVQRISRQIIL